MPCLDGGARPTRQPQGQPCWRLRPQPQQCGRSKCLSTAGRLRRLARGPVRRYSTGIGTSCSWVRRPWRRVVGTHEVIEGRCVSSGRSAAVARPAPECRGRRTSRPPGFRFAGADPASRAAAAPTAAIARPAPGEWVTCPIERSPRPHSSTISALNSGVNDLRGRGLLGSMLSMTDILPGAPPPMLVSVKPGQAQARLPWHAHQSGLVPTGSHPARPSARRHEPDHQPLDSFIQRCRLRGC